MSLISGGSGSGGGGGGGGSASPIYNYVVSGAAKASIDTGVDGANAGPFTTSAYTLEVYMYLRTDEAVVSSPLTVIFNNDTAANYDRESLTANTTTVSGGAANGQPQLDFSCKGASALANDFAALCFWIPNYSGTVGNKQGVLLNGLADSSAANTTLNVQSFYYGSGTVALTRIKILPTTAAKNFIIGSRLTVYAR